MFSGEVLPFYLEETEMIRYQRHESGMFPRFFCDTCNKPIEDDTGFVFWDREGRTAHAHMGPCAHALSQVSGGDAWPYSESLVLFLSNYSAIPGSL